MKNVKQTIQNNKKSLYEQKVFDLNGLKARFSGCGEKAVKFTMHMSGLSTKKKSTRMQFWLDYDELPETFTDKVKELVGENKVEIEDEDVSEDEIIDISFYKG